MLEDAAVESDAEVDSDMLVVGMVGEDSDEEEEDGSSQIPYSGLHPGVDRGVLVPACQIINVSKVR